jgi:hypothetical protein
MRFAQRYVWWKTPEVLRELGIAVWALVGALPAKNYDFTELAESYHMSPGGVQAADGG